MGAGLDIPLALVHPLARSLALHAVEVDWAFARFMRMDCLPPPATCPPSGDITHLRHNRKIAEFMFVVAQTVPQA
jgi:hypothetical protein